MQLNDVYKNAEEKMNKAIAAVEAIGEEAASGRLDNIAIPVTLGGGVATNKNATMANADARLKEAFANAENTSGNSGNGEGETK